MTDSKQTKIKTRDQVKEDARARALRENLKKRKAFNQGQKSENNDDAKP